MSAVASGTEVTPVLAVEGLTKEFIAGWLRRRTVHAVDGVSFTLARGETLGVMGESGCGKSTLARLITRLITPTSGTIRLGFTDLLDARGEALRQLRRQVQMIFQDAEGTLDPRMRVRQLLVEPLAAFGLLEGDRQGVERRLLDLVNLTPDLLDRHPHQLSGGQRQRIGLARALSLDPSVVVADEPAASLDLSVQAQMLELLQRAQAERGISCLLITHNLRVLRLMADRVAVMYLGRIVEIGPTEQVFNDPAHPYTQALVHASPGRQRGESPRVLTGEPPDPIDPPSGCHFHPRCPVVEGRCHDAAPALSGGARMVACHLVPSS